MNDEVFGKLGGVGRVDTEKLLSWNRTDMLIFDLFVTRGKKKNRVCQRERTESIGKGICFSSLVKKY